MKAEDFIQLVNLTIFNGTKEESLKQIWMEVNQPEKCVVLKKTGEQCGKSCIKNQATCFMHKPKPPCTFIHVTGPNKGKSCGMVSMNGITCRRHIPVASTKVNINQFLETSSSESVQLESYHPESI